MRDCCECFFDINGLQGDRNEPMQYCPYCGKRLTEKEFDFYSKHLGKKNVCYRKQIKETPQKEGR